MTKAGTLISVIIPTYNRSDVLIHTLNSILNQTYKYLEVVIVDDGSNDETEESVKGLNDKRIKYINIGRTKDIARVRNKGIENSTGDFIAFCDDDDLWIENKIEKQLQYVDDYNFICSASEIIDINGNVISRQFTQWPQNNIIIDLKTLLLGNVVITSSVLINKNILNRGFTEKQSTTSAEDYELWLRLSENNEIYYIAEPLVSFRLHANTSSFDYGEKYIDLLTEVIYMLSCYKGNPNSEIRKFARYGVVKQEKELCKLLFHKSYYLKFFTQSLFLLINVLHPTFMILYFKRKYLK